MIIDGRSIADELLGDLKEKVELCQKIYKVTPTLLIILIGDDTASKIYVDNKVRSAKKIGIDVIVEKYSNDISNDFLFSIIDKYNKDVRVSGIIVQMPIPSHINKSLVINAIDPQKDVDGFHPINVGRLYSGVDSCMIPGTAQGCVTLIQRCHNNLSGMHVTIIGRSNIVGRPLASLLINANCTVTLCNSYTKNLQSITYESDIVISAMGRPKMLTRDYFNKQATVIDVGISRVKESNDTKIVGDVDFNNVKDYVQNITPVPGGVGPMTVAYLLMNTVSACMHFCK